MNLQNREPARTLKPWKNLVGFGKIPKIFVFCPINDRKEHLKI